MTRRSKQLHDLQRVDLKRDATLTRLRRVLADLQGDPAVSRARTELAEADQRLQEVERALRQLTLERDALKAHLAEEDGKLYGGRITSPKEVQNLERETAALKRRLAQLDDAALEQMLARDDVAAAQQAAQARLAAVEAESATTLASLQAEKVELGTAARQLERQRQELLPGVPAPDLSLYERLRANKGGRAVSELRDDTCAACGLQLPVQDVSRIRSGDGLVQCPGCSRIVYG
jgi:predicted  nucleic acid-binding Zn-ribbon protein